VNAAAWLRAREEGVPAALSALLRRRLDGADGPDVPGVLLRAAHDQLAAVLTSPLMSRAQALDLLAADAFATYALEAAASEPETFAAHADAAMTVFAQQVERTNA
jgi:hypothetical protein